MNRSRSLSMSHCGCGRVIWACLFGAKSLVWGLFSFPDSLLLLQDLAIIPREYVQRSCRNIIYLKDGLDWVGLYSSKLFVFYLCALLKYTDKIRKNRKTPIKKARAFFSKSWWCHWLNSLLVFSVLVVLVEIWERCVWGCDWHYWHVWFGVIDDVLGQSSS